MPFVSLLTIEQFKIYRYRSSMVLIQVNTKKVEKVIIMSAINLRPFVSGRFVDNKSLSYCVGRLLMLINSKEAESTRFWTEAKEISDGFHVRLTSQTEKLNTRVASKSAISSESVKDLKLMNNHINISNMGVLDTSAIPGVFKLRTRFMCSYFTKDNMDRFFLNHISTVDSHICWLIGFNSFFVDCSLADEFLKFVREILVEKIHQ